MDALGEQVTEPAREEDMDNWAAKIAARTSPAFQEEAPPAKAAPKAKTGNEKLAAQALELLVNLNDGICVVFMAVGFHGSAMAISTREDAFREQAYAALLMDPALCRKLTEKAKIAGPMGLLLAYGMLAASIAPVVATEFKDAKERAAAKKRDRE